MPRCSICSHPERTKVDKAIASGTSLRDIAGQFSLSRSAVARHKANCFEVQVEIAERIIRTRKPKPEKLDSAVQSEAIKIVERRDADALDVMTELRNLFTKMNKMIDACDVWLTDPDDPTVYNLGPRAHEVMVTYEIVIGETQSGTPITKRKKANLQALLDIAEGKTQGEVTLVETKSADPRDLLLKTAAQLKGNTEFLARLIGQLDERPQINFLIMPEWQALRSELVLALRPFPEARAAVATRLAALKAGSGE